MAEPQGWLASRRQGVAAVINSEFTRILELALEARREDEDRARSGSPRRHASDPQVQNAIEELLSSPAYVSAEKLARIYVEERASRPNEPQRDLDKFLAEELQLSPELDIEDLRRLRREFAACNHPDRVSPSQRLLATRRMSLVNALIDKALKDKAAAAGNGAKP